MASVRNLVLVACLTLPLVGCGATPAGTMAAGNWGARSAAAGTAKPDIAQSLLTRFDTNKDGSISKDEIAAATAKVAKPDPVAAMDTDKDGKISADEFKKAAADRAAKAQASAADREQKSFDKLDANKDGFLSADELKAKGPEGGRPGFGGRQGFGGRPGMGGMPFFGGKPASKPATAPAAPTAP